VSELRLVAEHHRDSAPAWQRVQDAIDRFNVDVTGHRDYWPCAIYLRDASGRDRGGVTGHVWGGWLHVMVLWVDAELRRGGHGSRLLQAAEDYARAKGCRGVFLETFTFQAPDFYPRHGYEVFGRIDDYPPGHAQLYLRKRLA
jgi:ribosomal protein S18 acetylase RimI-like enzyme